jgi:hypothetical protein
LPIFRKVDLDDIGLMPGIDFSAKKNCESSLEKVVSMHRIGCLSVGRGFGGSPKKASTCHPPEFGYLAQKLLPLAGDLPGSGNRDFPAWSLLEQLV